MDNDGIKIEIDKPIKLEPQQEWICGYLNCLNEKEKICQEGILPSDLVRGALAVAENKENNPDWMAQAAHSYREILYGLGGKKDQSFYFVLRMKVLFWLNGVGIKNKKINDFIRFKTKRENIENVLQVLHEQKKAQVIADTIYKTYVVFTKIAHHSTDKNSKKECIKIFSKLGIKINENNFPTANNFNDLVRVFENALKESSLDPLKIHEKIDDFIKNKDKDISYLRLLFSLNHDAKRYYFSQVDENWLDWLWQNNFLKDIEKKAEDQTRYSYRMPELEYLARMAEKKPAKVAEIIFKTKISTENFNPEVIDRFLWIMRSLSAEQIAKLAKKIRDEKWVYLMKDFNKSGYEFDEIVKKLAEKKEGQALIELSGAILEVKIKQDLDKKEMLAFDNPFYLHDINYSGVFGALANVGDDSSEEALKFVSETIKTIINLAPKEKEGEVFEIQDIFSLYDVNLFTIELKDKRGYSDREDIKSLFAVATVLIKKTIGSRDDRAKDLFNKYLKDFPENRATWRLKLFALSQNQEVFKEELKLAMFRVFEIGERYFEIEGGAEYHQALMRCFVVFDEPTQREYVKKVFEYFADESLEDKDIKKWRKRDGGQLLCFIKDYLTMDEKNKAKEVFGISPDEVKCEPIPDMAHIRGGVVHNQSPVKLSDYTVDQIIENLKSDWKPEVLRDQFKGDDFLNPRGAEGLGEVLKEDFKNRKDDYLNKLPDFFDRNNMDPSYLYSILRSIEEILRDKNSFDENQTGQILNLFEAVRLSGETNNFKREDRKDKIDWLADWITVHKVMADILLYISENKENRTEIHKKYRDKLLNIIGYLFTIKDSPNKDDERPEYGELYTIAINSVRGRAFEAFVVFAENDGKALLDDTKDVYKKVLSDNSLAVRFVVGRYLATFYFRDKDFIVENLSEIFPKGNPDKKDVYLATWEGYLSSTLYDKLLVDLDEYYKHAVSLSPDDYTDRKYLKGLDESLAIHLSLAYIHLSLGVDGELLNLFWNKKNKVRHKEFISFIGSHCLTRDRAGEEWFKENKVDKKKILEFWNWILENHSLTEPESFSGFGYWINQDKEVLEDEIVIENMAKTMEISNGNIDWDYGLLKRLTTFAEIDPDNTFKIIKHYLLDNNGSLNKNRRIPFMHDGEIQAALNIVYKKGDKQSKEEIKNFINILIEKGSSVFWSLKDIIK